MEWFRSMLFKKKKTHCFYDAATDGAEFEQFR